MLMLIHPESEIVFRSWSKDDDGPRHATLENGQLRCLRGSLEGPELLLWESPKPKNIGEGLYRLGITVEKPLIIFQGDAGDRPETIWKSPSRN